MFESRCRHSEGVRKNIKMYGTQPGVLAVASPLLQSLNLSNDGTSFFRCTPLSRPVPIPLYPFVFLYHRHNVRCPYGESCPVFVLFVRVAAEMAIEDVKLLDCLPGIKL